MAFSVAGKIIVLLVWPFVFMVILYFKDKEKFMKRLKEMLERD
jgi:preprotein translocase subunit YajC